MRRRFLAAACALLALCAGVCGCSQPQRSGRSMPDSKPLGAAPAGSLQQLVSASVDLGASRARHVQANVTLASRARPSLLFGWGRAHHVTIDWDAGQAYALLDGPAPAMSTALGVPVHDYRSRSGVRFYAALDASVPSVLRPSVTGIGTITSYTPHIERALPDFRTDVPSGGLSPAQLLRVYDATGLAQDFTGKGKTVVFFELDNFTQSDLDAFTSQNNESPIRPVVDATGLAKAEGETTMDLQIVHEIAPDAREVVVNAGLSGHSAASVGRGVAEMYAAIDRKYPGAIWSISLGVSCEKFFGYSDLNPSNEALATALSHGTTAFISSGDTGGLECKGSADFGTPPSQSDVSVNALSTIPAITVVGGTALSTDSDGQWLGEQAWTNSPLQQGTSGGPSSVFSKPSWQQATGISTLPHNNARLTPDVSADADPATGAKIVLDGKPALGGGTSQSAPIWAGLTTLMNQYLEAHGGKTITDFNPLVYAVASSTPTAFHDVTLGGNSAYSAQTGFDLVTGLGTPDVAVLAPALLSAQRDNR